MPLRYLETLVAFANPKSPFSSFQQQNQISREKGGIRYEEQESPKKYFLFAKSLMNSNLKKEEWTRYVTNVMSLMVVKHKSLICYLLLIIIWVSY